MPFEIAIICLSCLLVDPAASPELQSHREPKADFFLWLD